MANNYILHKDLTLHNVANSYGIHRDIAFNNMTTPLSQNMYLGVQSFYIKSSLSQKKFGAPNFANYKNIHVLLINGNIYIYIMG